DGFFFGIKKENSIVLVGLYLIIKSRNIKYGYIPAGFLYNLIDEEIYNFFIDNITKISTDNKIVFTQIDPITPFDENFDTIIKKSKLTRLNQKLPIPQFTNVIDLSLTEEEILSKMKHKGRYNIKLAEKKGVKIRIGGLAEIPIFYKILCETTKRDGFRPNNEEYYREMLNIVNESVLLVAYHEDDIIAAGIFTFTKFQGLYYYGASSNVKRNLMAPYLLQWEAIKMAKFKDCVYFDFMGIANPDDPNDSLIGVTDFKLKFSEDVLKFNNRFHIVHNAFSYNLFKLIKSLKKLIKKS
ncbi:MAG TPA: peptidoglycan bridge formation glycyltransferase FemA/FemB family protein, partial [Spirochaetota bacterium]|nr:peptidoglycan bridge formation glycyltransferase FemA/FemB family protein [Spirochaetota bacterium]